MNFPTCITYYAPLQEIQLRSAVVGISFTLKVLLVKMQKPQYDFSQVQILIFDFVGPPSNIITSSNQNITAPAKLTLNCSADGKPKPTITWRRVSDNTVVAMPLKVIRGKNKEIYRCTTDNGVGNPLTKDVIVNILFSPKVILADKFFVGRGRNASLICQVEGNPKPTISWSHCDLPSVFCDKRYLTISKVQTARANYSCTARNALGIESATTVLIIGGYNIYTRMSITGESSRKDSVWEALEKEFNRVFANTQSYSEVELIVASFSCGSLIFDVVFRFRTEVAEDEIISTIQTAIVDGKLGNLSVNFLPFAGIPPVEQTSTAAPTSATPKSGAIGNKRPYEVPEERDARFYESEISMKDVNPAHLRPKNSTTKRQNPGELAYMPLQPTGEGSINLVRPSPNVEYAPLDIRTRSWEVERKDVKVEKIIGKGAFGQVAKGTAKNLPLRSGTSSVAIKMVKANARESDKRDLKSELELMKTLKPHPHVIKLLGCVTESEPLLVLIEYVPYGDLLGYLRKSRGLNDTYYEDPDVTPKSNLSSQQLMKFAWQIADGMNYLSLRKVVHRDLAARNVLVGERETCKITDFGMARDVQGENIYERKTKGRLPVKWTAYESLLYGQYTTKSDVWSYGVVLYEISTIGGSPYPRMEGSKIVDLLHQGYRMPKPEHVGNDLYEIMMNCWQSEPEARPLFSDLTQQLKRMENQHKGLINMQIYNNALYANLDDLNA
ncbi:fibroblast growth factor receptor 1-like isoform X3 [Acropora muricata]|uniref:fibroblast growth factor receptor 1-like isoform X3 n=1 Tax=Acropora muricata TaxID=159855 RepID=UPI0034E50704